MRKRRDEPVPVDPDVVAELARPAPPQLTPQAPPPPPPPPEEPPPPPPPKKEHGYIVLKAVMLGGGSSQHYWTWQEEYHDVAEKEEKFAELRALQSELWHPYDPFKGVFQRGDLVINRACIADINITTRVVQDTEDV